MSNPWSQAYEDLRKPYLEGKMAKKDYDGDGKIESGTDEYMGSKDKAIKKAMGKKITKEHHQKDASGNVIVHDENPRPEEEIADDLAPSSVEEEQLNELSKKTLNQYTYDAASEGGREKGIKMASKKLGKTKSARTVRKQKEDQSKGREVGHSRQEGPDRDANKSFGKPRQPYKKYMKKDKVAAEKRAKESGGSGNKATYGEDKISYTASYLDELSNKTLGGYIKKASKETRGNMMATQHGSGIPKKAKDIKLKQVNKRLKGMEKAGEKMAKEEVVDEMITLTRGDYASRNVLGSAYNTAKSKGFDKKIYKAGGGLGANFLPLANSHEPEGNSIDEKMEMDVKSMRYGDGEKEQAARLKKLANKRGMSMSKMKDHPQFKKEEKEPPRMQKGAMAYDGPNKARSLAADRVLAKTKAKREKMVKKESFSDWRSEFVWEDGDSVKKT